MPGADDQLFASCQARGVNMGRRISQQEAWAFGRRYQRNARLKNGDFSAKASRGFSPGAADIWSDSGVSLLVWQRGETNLPSWRTPPCAPVVRNGPLRTARTRWRFLNAAPPSGPSRQYAATGLSDGLEVAFREGRGPRVRERLPEAAAHKYRAANGSRVA